MGFGFFPVACVVRFFFTKKLRNWALGGKNGKKIKMALFIIFHYPIGHHQPHKQLLLELG